MITRLRVKVLRLRAAASAFLFAMSLTLGFLAGWSPAAGKETRIASSRAYTNMPNGPGCGSLCFVEPYSSNGSIPPTPTSGKRGLSTQLTKVDVGFIMDTTGSMGGEINNLKAALSTTIIPGLQARIPNLGIGVAGHDDVPISPYGDAGSGDLPFYLRTAVTTNTSAAQAAANSLTTHSGNDTPESQVLALYKAITGAAVNWPGGGIAADSPPAGTFGGMQFRSDAFTIAINITDAPHHNGKRALDTTGTNYDTTLQNSYSFTTWNADNVVTACNNAGAKFIAVNSDGVRSFDPMVNAYGFAAFLTDKTGSYVPVSAFISRPPGCSPSQCCTGINGVGVAPDGPGGNCRLIWTVDTAGSGLGNQIVNGVGALLNTVKFDIYVLAYNDPAETTDVVGNFMQSVEPDPTGGTDPATGDVCVTFPPGELADNFTGPKALIAGADGVPDTIAQTNPAPVYCFKVTPKPNSVIPQTTTQQTFRAWLRVLAIKPNGIITLGPDRDVLFIVPPASPMATGAVSRKIHGGAGTFDVDLPLTGPAGIEPRAGGGTNDYTLVVTFSSNINVTGSPQAQITLGAATIGTGGVGNGGNVAVNGNSVTIPLTDVDDQQTINVTLNGVNSGSTNSPAANVVIPMSRLLGDTSGNGAVNASDVTQTKLRSGQALTSTNFRSDLSANGSINATDVSLVKANSGHALP
jgi:hypothetical protein